MLLRLGQLHQAILVPLTALATLFTLALTARMTTIPLTPRVGRFALSFTTSRAQVVLKQWRDSGLIETAKAFQDLDYYFIPAYTLSIAGFALLAARAVPQGYQSTWLASSTFPLIAGMLDVFENICLGIVLDSTDAAGHAVPLAIAGGAASLKLLLLAASVLFILFAWLPGLLAR